MDLIPQSAHSVLPSYKPDSTSHPSQLSRSTRLCAAEVQSVSSRVQRHIVRAAATKTVASGGDVRSSQPTAGKAERREAARDAGIRHRDARRQLPGLAGQWTQATKTERRLFRLNSDHRD